MVKLEAQVKDLLLDSKSEEAEAYFAVPGRRGICQPHQICSRKKRETRKEALELYKMAVFYGKEEAKEKVTELEKII